MRIVMSPASMHEVRYPGCPYSNARDLNRKVSKIAQRGRTDMIVFVTGATSRPFASKMVLVRDPHGGHFLGWTKERGPEPRAALKVRHDAEDQRAYLHDLQRNGLPHGEAADAGNSQNLSCEVH